MSFDIAIWASEDSLEDEDAEKIYQELAKTGKSGALSPSPKIAVLIEELSARWPELSSYDDASIDESPWMSNFDKSDSHLIVTFSQSRLYDVWPFLDSLAKKHELILYIPVASYGVYLPPRLSRKRTRLRAKRKKEAGEIR